MKVVGPGAASLQRSLLHSKHIGSSKRTWWPRARPHVRFALAIIVVGALLGLAGRASHYLALDDLQSLNLNNDSFGESIRVLQKEGLSACNIENSDSTQRFFEVNLPVYFGTIDRGATYANAKLISLAWNLIVGQGGRILHGWFLCFHVLPDALTRLLEGQAGLPYNVLIKLYFSGTSLEAIWAAFAALFRNRHSFPTMCALSLALTYTLLLPTILDAATGYYQPSETIYRLPAAAHLDGAVVGSGVTGYSFSSGDDLQPCYSFNDSRVAGAAVVVFDGPPGQAPFGDGSTDRITWIGGGGFYNNISFYAETELRLRIALLDRCNDLPSSFELTRDPSHPDTEQMNVTFPDFSVYGNLHPGYTILDPDHNLRLIKDQSPTCGFPSSASMGSLCDYGQCTESERNPAQTLTLNTTTNTANGQLPYNSTIWWNSTSISLAAPMVNLTDGCFPYGTSCLCYNGYPLTFNYTDPQYQQCVTTSGYAWGFAISVCIFALSLELAWLLICYVLWLDAQINSKLVKHRRRGGGEIRNLLDFAARINLDLGTDTIEMSNDELRALLKKHADIKHEVTRDDAGELEIGVFTGSRRNEAAWVRRRKQARGPHSIAQGAQGMITDTTIVPQSPDGSASKLEDEFKREPSGTPAQKPALGSPSVTSQVSTISVPLESPSQSSIGSGALFADEAKRG